MFVEAVALLCEGALETNGIGWLICALARNRTSWAEHMYMCNTFLELFYELYLAGSRWHQSPRPPFKLQEHGVLAHAIDDYHNARGLGEWKDHDLEIDLMSVSDWMASVEDGNIAGAEKEKESPAVLAEPAVQDRDGDVAMGDEPPGDREVSNLRRQLSQSNLVDSEVMDVHNS
ncbi:unnamed protein product [Discula destructiva]